MSRYIYTSIAILNGAKRGLVRSNRVLLQALRKILHNVMILIEPRRRQSLTDGWSYRPCKSKVSFSLPLLPHFRGARGPHTLLFRTATGFEQKSDIETPPPIASNLAIVQENCQQVTWVTGSLDFGRN